MRKINYLNIIRRISIIIFFYFYLFSQVFANILISEVFPNTIDDKNLEYIELYNSGSKDISLDGYFLEDKSGKRYNFGNGKILNPSEKKKYYRTQTKIILNNTNEELYLYNSGTLVDSFSYKTSIKGEVINKIFGGQDGSGSLDSETGSGYTDSSSGNIETGSGNFNNGSGSIETGTGEIETSSGETASGIIDILEIPEINIEVQSGIEYLTGNIWKCKKEACKVNLNLEKVFTGVYEKNNYGCLWDFGSGAIYSTGTKLKCNPGYVDYGSGIFEVLAKIYEKGNENNYKTGGLTIKNDFWGNNLVILGTGGENNGSGYTDSSSGNIETGSGNFNNGSGSIETNSGILEIPEIDIEVQSGIEYLTGDIWKCKKEACKINLNLEKVFTGVYEKNNYGCLWDFGSGALYSTGTKLKCNPGYVDYGSGSFEVLAKIYEKGNEDNYKTGGLTIKNDFWENNLVISGTGGENNGSGTLESGSGNVEDSNTGSLEIENGSGSIETGTGGENTGNLLAPKIVLDFQNPTYLLEKDIKKQNYNCDRTKTECKVNLDLRNSFTGSYKESDFNCQIDFGFGSGNLTGQENKCNPTTITYPIGDYNLNFKIISKISTGIFSIGSLIIQNKGYIKPISKSSGGGVGGSSNIYIKKPEIIIQSGLENVNGIYQCKKQDCKINLKYDIKNKDERCLWDFPGGQYKLGTLNKCNPGYIDYFYGNFKIKLKVYQKNNKSNFKENYLNFINIKEEKKDIVQEKESKEEVQEKDIKILLQGKKVNYKEKKEDTIICKGISKCNINLISEIKGYKKKKDLTYNWDFGNGEKSNKANPTGVWFKTGEYDVVLKIFENNTFFGEKKIHISVLGEVEGEKEEEKQELKDYNYDLLKIFRVLPNPRGNDNKERIELINNSDNLINLKGCFLDDDIGKGSKVYKIKENFFIKPGKTRKIYKTFSKLNLNNTQDSVNLFCNSKLIDSLLWDFKVKEGYYLSHKRLFKGTLKAYVLKVIDGDTIFVRLDNLEKIKIRLIGVDTPENNNYKKYYEKYGKEASLFTKKYLEDKDIIIENDVDNIMDIYGRRLAYIYIDGINFNKLLLEKGIARPYFKYPFKYEEDFKLAYKKAQKQKLGIWQEKELKKIVLEEIKKDDFIKEDMEEIMKLKDENENNIPDEFEEIDYIESRTGNIIEKINKNKSFGNYDLFVKKTFTQSIRKIKKGLKISGEAIPFTQISLFIDGLGVKKSMLSDKYGKYEFLITNFKETGTYYPRTILIDKLGNEFVIRGKKEIIIDSEYLEVLKNTKKKSKIKLEKKKKRKTKKRKIKKEKINDKEKTINLIIPKVEAQDDYISSTEEVNIMYVFLLMIISLVLTGILFKKRGLI